MVQQTEKFSNLQSYFERAIPQIVIAMNHSGETVACVPATDSNDPYTVWIDESEIPHATKCSCNDHWYRKSYCKHMQAADLYYQRIAAMFAHDEQDEVVESELTPDEIAAIAEEANMQKLAEYRRHVAENAYEILGATKHVHCGGCHQICGEEKGDRCKPGFCFWNSFWTEAQRNAA